MKNDMKISFLGAGSVGFTQTLVRDILKVKKLQNIEISLHDISRSNLLMVAELIQKDIKANNLPTKLSIDPIRKESIRGAKYIITGKNSDTGVTCVQEAIVVHDGTSSFISNYGTTCTAGTDAIFTLTTDISGGNVRLLVGASSANWAIWAAQHPSYFRFLQRYKKICKKKCPFFKLCKSYGYEYLGCK